MGFWGCGYGEMVPRYGLDARDTLRLLAMGRGKGCLPWDVERVERPIPEGCTIRQVAGYGEFARYHDMGTI